MARFERSDTMAREVGVPSFRNWCAAEDLGLEIAKQIAKDDEDDGPGAVFEAFVNVEDAEVEEEDGEFVAEETYEVGS